jgi:hypothetical protein
MGSVKQDGGKAGHAMSTAMSPDAARLIEAVAQLGPTIAHEAPRARAYPRSAGALDTCRGSNPERPPGGSRARPRCKLHSPLIE